MIEIDEDKKETFVPAAQGQTQRTHAEKAKTRERMALLLDEQAEEEVV